MKELNALRLILLIVSSALLSSCAPTPPDVPVCQDLDSRMTKDPETGHLILKASPSCMKAIGEPRCGHCTAIVSGTESFIGESEKVRLNGKPWSQVKAESVLVPAESYAALSAFVINACKKMSCNDEINRFKVRLDSLQK